MSTTLIVVASATPASVLGALAMLLPALRAREVARVERAYADKTFAAAESLADEVERTRNLPWYWPTGPAIEAAPAEHEAEVLHVDFPTSELRLADGLARLADEVGLVQALSDRPAVDEDEVGDEQPGEAVSEAPARLWARFCAWLRSAWADIRDLAKSNERRNAEFWADLSEPSVTEPVEAEADEDRWAEDAAIVDGPDMAKPVNREPYRGRHWLKGTEHTGAWPVINRVPAQRDGGEN